MTHMTPEPVSVEQLSSIVAELQARAQAQEEEKFVKAQSDITIKAFERATSYNNVILVAGYAGAFTIWSFTKSQLSDKSSMVIALFLLVSLTFFIVFEVVKMVVIAKAVTRKMKVFNGCISVEDKVKALKDIEEINATVTAGFLIHWKLTMLVTTVSAAVALGLLAYNFVAVLVGWPRWPC